MAILTRLAQAPERNVASPARLPQIPRAQDGHCNRLALTPEHNVAILTHKAQAPEHCMAIATRLAQIPRTQCGHFNAMTGPRSIV